MLTPLKPEMLSQAGLAERAKRFRTVAASFHRNAELLFAGSAFGFSIDDEALARAFGEWRLSGAGLPGACPRSPRPPSGSLGRRSWRSAAPGRSRPGH